MLARRPPSSGKHLSLEINHFDTVRDLYNISTVAVNHIQNYKQTEKCLFPSLTVSVCARACVCAVRDVLSVSPHRDLTAI